jgi:site-specific recombinase XerD
MAGPRRKPGLLGPHYEGYREWLLGLGYSPGAVRNMLKELGQVGCWMASEGLDTVDLDEARFGEFRTFRREAGYRKVMGPRAMVPLLRYLRETGVTPPARPATEPLDLLLGRYRRWMVEERGLAATTVLRYENAARRFLTEQAMTGDTLHPQTLMGADVNAFLLRECARVSAGSAKGRVAELRSVLRFLYLHGIAPMRLGWSVPPVGGWRLATLPPPTISPADVRRLLEGCDRHTVIGRRDFAMMTLIARLGLRSIEVARLELEDIDWRGGELLIRGKGGRRDRLPLPPDVGQSLVDYLSGRSSVPACRQVFLTQRAPHRPIRADLVGDVVQRACVRAGVGHVGPHRLRHGLARELLRRGAGLMAIGQVLRHRDLATTALYAKVDLDTLRQVAQPWPGQHA